MENTLKAGNGSPSGKRSILVADDEATLRLGFSYTLADGDTEVDMAGDGTEALKLLSSKSYDLLIIDLRMPGMDGINVIEAARLSGNRVPVILCSAEFTPGIHLRAIRCDVVDFLLKPANPAQIRNAVGFVMAPPSTAHGHAMCAARSGDPATAARLLAAAPDHSPVSKAWQKIFRSVLDNSNPDKIETTEMEFAALALNARSTV